MKEDGGKSGGGGGFVGGYILALCVLVKKKMRWIGSVSVSNVSRCEKMEGCCV